jgi:hypothetical protein
MQALAILAVGLAWLGASTAALSHGRRGLALGVALTGAGLAGASITADPLGAAVLAVAALFAALLRLRDGAGGWGLLPAGSTPGIVASVVVLAASVVLAGTALQGPNLAPRVAPLAVALVSATRLLSTRTRQVALAVGSTLALALGAFGGLGDVVAGSLVAVALSAIPATEAEEVTA